MDKRWENLSLCPTTTPPTDASSHNADECNLLQSNSSAKMNENLEVNGKIQFNLKQQLKQGVTVFLLIKLCKKRIQSVTPNVSN